MRVLPTRSPGVLVAPMADRSVVYDLVKETAHFLNPAAGELLVRCDGDSGVDDLVDEWAVASESDRAVVAADVDAALASFVELGLVDRDETWTTPPRPVGSTRLDAAPGEGGGGSGERDGGRASPVQVGATHRVIDFDLAFRSPDPELLEAIDTHLGTGGSGPAPNMFFDVELTSAGDLRLFTETERTYPSLDALLDRLASVVNEYAVRTHSCASLHAAAVRSPAGAAGAGEAAERKIGAGEAGEIGAGEIVLLPAPSGHGKSTLAAALVAAGWDYLGDEAIGVRPATLTAVGYPKRLALDAASRKALGLAATDLPETQPEELRPGVVRLDGDVGPIGRVVLPRYVEGAEPTLEVLDPAEAIVEILANTLNLARSGQGGLTAVCDLAAAVPVYCLTHSDAKAAVDLLASLVTGHRAG